MKRWICRLMMLVMLATGTAWAEEAAPVTEAQRALAEVIFARGSVTLEMLQAAGYRDFWYPSEELAGVARQDSLKWGYIDSTGAEVIPAQFDSASYFSEGVAKVRKDDLYGFIDHTGAYVIEPKYINVGDYSEGLAAVCVPAPGEQPTTVEISGQQEVRYENTLWGYIDQAAVEVIEPRYTEADNFTSWGWAVAKDKNENAMGVIDRQGEWVLKLDYEPAAVIDISEDDGMVTVMHDNDADNSYYDLSSGEPKEVKVLTASVDLTKYMPFTGSKVATLDGEPTLAHRVSREHRLPTLDGATALFPVYAAFVQAVYPDDTHYEEYDGENSPLITCTKTNVAYERLINGEADIIFVAAPSDEELKMAADKGVEFDMIPFGREAFVFVVNQENPIENITLDELRLIYSGEITLWSQVGVEGLGEIIPYQRPKNSGSQTALEALMGDVPLMEPPQEYVAWGMDDILETVEYRNFKNALGYSFRFFCTDMMKSDVKLLSLDGVAPTPENIANGSYPQSSTLYAIRLKGNDNPNVTAFIDWMLSDQGMELIEKSGYVSLRQQEKRE